MAKKPAKKACRPDFQYVARKILDAVAPDAEGFGFEGSDEALSSENLEIARRMMQGVVMAKQ